MIFDFDAGETLFLNSRRGRQRSEYLCYTSGRTVDRSDLGSEQREFLARVLGMPVAQEQASQWAARSQADDPASLSPSETRGAGGEGSGRRTLGEFELLSELGRGAMGVVYRAWQPSLGRQVAIKKLLRSGDERAERRFRREIHALGRVEHPHLVKVFTSGADGDNWFYVMELVEGASLADVWGKLHARTASVTDIDLPTWDETVGSVCAESRQKEKPLSDHPPVSAGRKPPVDETVEETPRVVRGPATIDGAPLAGRSYVRHIVELMGQVAEAAHALHEAGVVHRDIKPGNIMVTADGRQAVLMDLGLAQFADDEDGRLTRTRQFVGTLRYASPQQILAVGRLDRRSDVYSLGATLWELLALRPLFAATDETPTPELMEKIQHEEPQRLRHVHTGLPADLEAIVHKCLEKSPEGRYASAAELARDLRRFLAGEPVRARHVSRLERAWKWAKRRPVVAALTAALVVAIAGGMVAAIVLAAHSAALAQLAQDHERVAREQRQLAELNLQRLIDVVETYLTDVSEKVLPYEPNMEPLRKQLLERAKDFYERFVQERKDDPRLRFELGKGLFRLAIITAEIDSPPPGIALLQQALSAFRDFQQDDDPQHQSEIARCHHHLGRLLRLDNPIGPKTVEHYESALKIWQRLTHSDESEPAYQLGLAQTCNGLGNVYARTKRPAEAQGSYESALEIFGKLRRSKPANHPDASGFTRELAVTHMNLGSLLHENRNTEDAMNHYLEAQDLQQQLVAEEPQISKFKQDLARTRLNLGKLYLDVKKSEEAQSCHESAVEIGRELTERHPKVLAFQHVLANNYQRLAWVYLKRGQVTASERTYRQAVTLLEKLLEVSGHSRAYQGDIAPCYFNLARVCLMQVTSGTSDAEQHAREAVEFLRKAKGAQFFKNKSDVQHLRKKPFDSLRDRADFIDFLREVEATISALRPPNSADSI